MHRTGRPPLAGDSWQLTAPAAYSSLCQQNVNEILVSPVAKALWYIDSHFEQDICLDDVANCAGVSRFHLLRAFGNATGQSIMRYVRARRLSQAAQRLAAGAEDILTVAIECGYGSHEAFTRAFGEQFGVTPESIRDRRHLDGIQLQRPLAMNHAAQVSLSPPRFHDGQLLLLAGLAQRYTCERMDTDIPGQWQRFTAYLGHVTGQIGGVAYGVCYNFDEAGSMDYLCAVEVRDYSDLPSEFARLRVAPQRYAIFTHAEHISAIRSTWNAIWNDWLPASACEVLDAPFFERYDVTFDPHTGNGGVELWVPVRLR